MTSTERVGGEVAIDIREALVSSARQKLSVLSKESMAAENCTIFRVPAHIRRTNKHLYEPQTVAIGPYGLRDVEPQTAAIVPYGLHDVEPQTVAIGPYGRRDEPSLRAMEHHKWRFLHDFLDRRDSDIEDCVAEILELEPEARGRYFERVELSTMKFAGMLLLDGCFILEFLSKWMLQKNGRVCAGEWSLPLIRCDLLLLENQIPFSVLKKLFEPVTLNVNGKTYSLEELLVSYLTSMNVESPEESSGEGMQANPEESSEEGMQANPEESSEEGMQANPEENSEEGMQANPVPRCGDKDFHHLLHFYYHCYVTESQTDGTSTICCTILKWLRPSRIFDSLLSCILLKICRSHKKRLPRTIPSATELLEAGVTISKKKQKQKRLSSFLDVAFEDGVLEIPLLSVENSTLPRFSNLVAFEQCGRCESHKAYMTSYAAFMKCLIDTPKDVAILRERGILENKLASDEELATFFNRLPDWATLDYDNHYLSELFQDVGEYCDIPWHNWRATLVRDYFSNPWSFISFIAAAVLLVLTILQTVFTFYSYYHPRNPSLSSWELAASD